MGRGTTSVYKTRLNDWKDWNVDDGSEVIEMDNRGDTNDNSENVCNNSENVHNKDGIEKKGTHDQHGSLL